MDNSLKVEAQNALNQFLEENELIEATQSQLDEWYNQALQGAAPPTKVELDDWEERTGYLKKEFYVYGPGIEFLRFSDADSVYYLLRVEFGIWQGQDSPTLEVYDE